MAGAGAGRRAAGGRVRARLPAARRPGGRRHGRPVAGGPPSRGLLAATLRERGVLLGALLLAVYVGLEIGIGNWAFSYLVEDREQADLLAGYTVSGYWLGLTLGRFLISPAASPARPDRGRDDLWLPGRGQPRRDALTWLVPVAAAASAGLVAARLLPRAHLPDRDGGRAAADAPRLVPTAIGVMNAGSVIGGAALPWLAGAHRTGRRPLDPASVHAAAGAGAARDLVADGPPDAT